MHRQIRCVPHALTIAQPGEPNAKIALRQHDVQRALNINDLAAPWDATRPKDLYDSAVADDGLGLSVPNPVPRHAMLEGIKGDEAVLIAFWRSPWHSVGMYAHSS